jgi:hypothetical protein
LDHRKDRVGRAIPLIGKSEFIAGSVATLPKHVNAPLDSGHAMAGA